MRPGIDCVRDIGGARLAVDCDRMCPADSGDAVRGRYGIDDREEYVCGLVDVGLGSVLRLGVGGFLFVSMSNPILALEYGLVMRSEGRGEDLNSSMRSVSGTGSMMDYQH